MFNLIKDRYERFKIKKLQKKYPTWNYENWMDDTEFIWGVKSWDCLIPHSVCMYTMNDIDIIYNHKTKKYYLSIETAYQFENTKLPSVANTEKIYKFVMEVYNGNF